MEKPRRFSAKNFFGSVCAFFGEMGRDRITVFAAQASYFIIISCIPFLILLLSVVKYFVDVSYLVTLVENHISGNLGDLIKTLINEAFAKGGAPLVSVTAVTTLWTSSRAVSSVTRGIGDIYRIRYTESFFMDVIRSFIYTVAFIILLIGMIVAVMFAGTIKRAAGESVPLLTLIFNIVSDSSIVVLSVVLTLFFALLFNTVAKKGKRIARDEYELRCDSRPIGYLRQLPGALFSAVGWVLFSYFYSVYLTYFPTGYYIYGSLAAALLLLLWLYTCMIILLMGAEINKFIFRGRAK